TGLDVVTNTVGEKGRELTQELRVDFDWDSLRLLLGAFYSNERTDRAERLAGGRDSLLADLNLLGTVNIDFGTGLRSESQALFGQLSWKLLTDLELTGGLRYSRDQKKVHLTSVNDAILPPPIFGLVAEQYDFDEERRWNSLDPLVSVKYQ